MKPYVRKVQYYETDKMGVAHHANYIHWMEEARIDFMDQLGFPYERMEAEGLTSPVRAVTCEYRRPCTFGDIVTVQVSAEAVRGAALTILYDIRNEAGETVCTARSEHVFLDRGRRIVRMKREMPDFCTAIESLAAGGSA